MNRSSIADWGVVVLAAIATMASLKFAQNLVAPVVLGLVMAVVMAPVVRQLTRWGVPTALCAFGALLLTGLLVMLILLAVGPVVALFLEEIPRMRLQAVQWLDALASAFGLSGAVGENLPEMDGDEAVAAAIPSLLQALWFAPNFMAQLMIFAGTLFFFLLTREDLYAMLSRRAAALRQADKAVSHYFTTITLINAGLGLAVFGATSAYGLVNPVLWGFAAFVLNFVLYLGPISIVTALLVAGALQFSGLMIVAPALTFFAFNLIEAQFVTPTLVGHRLRLNPLGVFLAILFGLWLWGPVGGIVALPVLVWVSAYLAQGTAHFVAPDATSRRVA